MLKDIMKEKFHTNIILTLMGHVIVYFQPLLILRYLLMPFFRQQNSHFLLGHMQYIP